MTDAPRLGALLFDLDGTLCDSDPVHARAWTLTLAPLGVAMTPERYRAEISGRINAEIVADLFPDRALADRDRVAADKEALFRELAGALRPLPGLDRLLGEARARGLRTALVTNAPRDNAAHMLRALGLDGAFDAIVLAEEVGRGKPDPLPYRTALDRLGLEPDAAVAFEDTPSGLRSAVGAGLRAVALTTGHDRERLLAAGAGLAIADFADAALAAFLGWD